jgi:hypothetical protein
MDWRRIRPTWQLLKPLFRKSAFRKENDSMRLSTNVFGLKTSWMLLVGLTALMGRSPCFAETSLPGAIRKALERNAAAMNPMTLTWTQQAKSSSPQAIFQYMDWPNGPEFYLPVRARHTWQDGKFYTFLNLRHQHEPKIVKGHDINEFEREVAFDGTTFYIGEGVEGTKRRGLLGTLSIESLQNILAKKIKHKGSDESSQGLLEPSLYYRDLGFWLPMTYGEFATADRQDSLVLWLLRKGAKLITVRDEMLAGKPVVRLELKGSEQLANNIPPPWNHLERRNCLYRFYLDPAHGYAAARREELAPDGKLGILSEGRDFIPIDDTGVWLPKHITVHYHTYFANKKGIQEKPLFTDDYTLEKYDTNRVPDKTFVISYDDAPGMFVQRDVLPDGKVLDRQIHYQVPPTPQMLDRVIEEAQARASYTPFRSRWLLIGALNLLLALVVVAIWRYRRNRGKSGGVQL